MDPVTYFAWVPTVSGRLSFSVATTTSIGQSLHQFADVADGGRHFVCAVVWDTSDFTIPFLSGSRRSRAFFERLLTGNETRFVFLCHFEIADDFESLNGEVIIVPQVEWQMRHVELRARLDATSELAETGKTRSLGTLPDLPGAICTSQFQIFRNGACEIQVTEIDVGVIKTLAREGQDPSESIASFLYSFIREIFHTHKYHSPDSDTIITAYTGDWKSKVCASLLRKVIVLRKMGDLDSLRRASGILTYAESFMNNVMKDGDKLWSPKSITTTREGLNTDIARADARNWVSIPKRVSGWVRLVAAGLVALVGYLRINYDLTVSVMSEEKSLFSSTLNMAEIATSTSTKLFLVDFYLRYTDEFVISAIVLFVLGSLLSWEISFLRSAARDMLRIAVIHRAGVIITTALLSALCLALAIFFVVDAF